MHLFYFLSKMDNGQHDVLTLIEYILLVLQQITCPSSPDWLHNFDSTADYMPLIPWQTTDPDPLAYYMFLIP